MASGTNVSSDVEDEDDLSRYKKGKTPRILMVATIDLGATYSGIAFYFVDNYTRAPFLISGKVWMSCRGAGAVSAKTPTTLLLNPNKEFAGFGYEAEDIYTDLAEDNAHYGYYYLKNFKKILHTSEKLNRDTMVTDSEGKHMSAMIVFSESIKYLKDELCREIKKRGDLVREQEIKWVLTVPVFRGDDVKQFMREAARKAGIDTSRLLLVSELDAASVYAKETLSRHRADYQGPDHHTLYDVGTKFALVDLGGGTVDVTVMEVLQDRSLKGLHKSSGGTFGGMSVNEAFLNFLKEEEVIGEDVLAELNEHYKADYLDLEREIENKKRSITGDREGRLQIKLPGNVFDIYKNKKSRNLNTAIVFGTKYAGKIEIKHGHMKIDKSIVSRFFDRALDSLMHYMKEILKTPVSRGISEILLVGGFAESEIMKNGVCFDGMKIVVPEKASLAVVHGAVLYGHNPGAVKEPITGYTYGTRSMRYVLKDFDSVDTKKLVRNVPFCSDVLNVPDRRKQIKRQDHHSLSAFTKFYRFEKGNKDKSLMVAAIDFGTTYSGFAFSYVDSYKRAPLLISGKVWKSCRGAGTASDKTPTTLLLNPNKEFAGFGYEAEDIYTDLAEDNAHFGYYYFKNFKMILHNSEKLNRETMVTDSQGKHVSAMIVFSESIRYLKDELCKEMKKSGAHLREQEVKWVLTVPAIWDDNAKQFMREAAKKAGIDTSRLLLALEPEAASLYAKEMLSQRKSDDQGRGHLAPYDVGTKFAVVDLGGGTVDVTLREVLPDRSLKELHKASGGAWGGMSVNEAFLNFLKEDEVIGEDVLAELNQHYKADYLDLEREIENKKRSLTGNREGRLQIKLPGNVFGIYKNKTSRCLDTAAVAGNKYAGKIEIKLGNMKIDKSVVASFFDKALDSLVHHLKDILDKPVAKGISEILLVGGFAESSKMKDGVCESGCFDGMKIVVPDNAGLAVVQGAVLYGHNPRDVKERVARYTYGTRCMRYFLRDYDPEDKIEWIGNEPYCKDVFNKLAEVDQIYTLGEPSEPVEMFALTSDMTKMSLHLYKSTEKDPKYTTEESCTYLGKIVADMPDKTKGRNRAVSVQLVFGDTEIVCSAKDKTTGKRVQADLDMLS